MSNDTSQPDSRREAIRRAGRWLAAGGLALAALVGLCVFADRLDAREPVVFDRQIPDDRFRAAEPSPRRPGAAERGGAARRMWRQESAAQTRTRR